MKKAVIGAPALDDGADAEKAPGSHPPDGERPLCHLASYVVEPCRGVAPCAVA
jgi:hypothetical protein